MPQDAATWRQEGWSQQEELLATQIELVDEGLLRLAQLQVGQKVAMPKRPIQILRPGEERKKPPNVVSIAEFGRMNEGGDS